jgi:hypothetical protein
MPQLIEVAVFSHRIGLFLNIFGSVFEGRWAKCQVKQVLDAFEDRLHFLTYGIRRWFVSCTF